MLFQNRTDAGRRLAAKLKAYAGRLDVLVLALPREPLTAAAGRMPAGIDANFGPLRYCSQHTNHSGLNAPNARGTRSRADPTPRGRISRKISSLLANWL